MLSMFIGLSINCPVILRGQPETQTPLTPCVDQRRGVGFTDGTSRGWMAMPTAH